MAELPPPPDGMALTHFIVSGDVERSRRFYTEVLGGRQVFGPVPVNVQLANSWIVISTGGGPTGSAASSTSGSKTSMPSMPSGARGVLSS
jgi:hypothetical protein